jgi:dihydropyrimidinase/dihydroorotase
MALRAVRNGLVATPEGIVEGGVIIEDGRIAAVASNANLPTGTDVLDAEGSYVLPGVVDPEAHLGSNRGLDEDFLSESRAAVASGVTTWGLQLTTHTIFRSSDGRPSPETHLRFGDLVPAFVEIGQASSVCDFFLTPLLMTVDQADEIPRLAGEFGATTYKLYMHMRLGREALEQAWPQAPLLGVRSFDDGLVYTAMSRIAELRPAGLISMHCENWEIARVREQELRQAGRTDMGAWHERSPGYLEAMHVRSYGYLAHALGCRMHVQHVTAIETLQALERLRGEGIEIYGQTAAHYLVLEADSWKINTPIRPAEHRAALWTALRTGVVNSTGSDHVCRGMTRDAMDRGSVWDSISGFPSRVEAHLPVLLTFGVSSGRIGIERLVEVTASNPARLWGIYPRKGAIQPGSDADLVIVDMTKRMRLDSGQVVSATGWSAYEGTDFQGWPVATIRRGDLVAEWSGNQCTVEDGGSGRYLPRDLDYPAMINWRDAPSQGGRS